MKRKHQHLLEIARALQFQSNLPTKFWGECVLSGAYLINRMPLVPLENKTPYEKLFGKKPDNTNLKAFGCLPFVSTIKQGRSKFHPRSNPSVFIGYPHGQKAYKIYDLITHKIVISRDVIFYEKHFPYHFDVNVRLNAFFLTHRHNSYYF